ncbi:RIMS-binding protein 2 [Armadillidium vulgare]|nr:RIMS-binding protein 2 [Armadillidium vulgare]
MKDAADRRKELEKQHAEALSQLREKQAALEGAIGRHGSYADKKAYSETIEALQSKIRELEKKAEVQSLRHEELLLEMQSLKKTHSSPKNSWSRSGSLSAELPSPESGDITPDSSQILSNGSTARSTPVPHYGMGLGPSHYAFDVMGLAEFSDSILSNPPYSTSPLTGQAGVSQFNSLSSGIFTATTSTFSTAGDHGVSTHTAQNISVNSEIDRIMAKIQQDNKILAELDKSRSTIGVATPACTSSFTSNTLNALSNMSSCSFRTGGTNFSNIFTTPLTSTATTVAALDLSQPLTNPLINTFTNPIDSLLDPNISHPSLGLGGISGSSSTGFTGSNFLTNPLGNSPGVLGGGASGSGGGLAGLDLGGLNLVNPVTGTFLGGGGTSTFNTAASLPTIITTLYDKDDKNIVNGNLPGVLLPPGLETDNRVLDVLEIPGKGRCHVYIARYSYDPFQQSPNENPEAELALNAGDYVLVWGHMDEDGFFDGELLDGRRGLVPSNFVEKLVGDDLIEFHQSIVIGLRDCDESVSTSVPQDLDFISQDDSQFLMDLFFSVLVPPPVQLTLERQLNKSILIGWNPPPDCPPGTIESYHVYVNGLLKTTVKASERTRALVEGVDSTKLHRISVRSVTPNRRTSRDAACTMVIGKDCPVGPTSVRATNITSTSAVISWMPSNSNFQHTVCVNSVEVRTVKPGVYRHTITGLSPNTIYRVSIRAKNLRAPQFDEKSSLFQERLSAGIEFRTLPKGLPDPPVDVQVEIGPQDGSLLVTWLPVTLNSSSGTSNGALVTGYAVYADGKKVTEVDSPTGDHALIDLNKIHGFEPRQITSLESDEVLYSDYERIAELSDIAEESETELSDNDLQGDHKTAQGTTHRQGPLPQAPAAGGPRGLKDRLLGRRAPPVPGARTDHLGQTILEHEDNLSDKEIYPGQGIPPHQGPAHHPHPQQQPASSIPSIEITKDTPSGMDPHYDGYPEDEYDMGRSRYDSRHPPPRGRQPPVPNPHRQPPRDPRDLRDPRDMRDPRADPRDYRDSHAPHTRDRRDPRDMRESRDYRDPSDSRDRYDDSRHRGQDYGRGRPGEHPRIFVALFDYDPPTMSPNPDACDEELGFREGQLIKVFGDKDPDGFYWGEASGRGGYVPCNMVSEVQVDDERVAQELLKESEAGRRRRDGSVGRRGHAGDRWGDIYANMPVRKMIAMYDYDPQELSPNVDSEVELSFQTGDIIYVYGDMDDDGFYMGELRGQRGLVPSNFLQDAPHDYDEHSYLFCLHIKYMT